MFKIKNYGKIIFQAPKINGYLLAKPLLYPKISKTSQ